MQTSEAATRPGGSTATGLHLARICTFVIAPLGFITLIFWLKLFARDDYMLLIKEDGYFESLTFLAYWAAAVFAFTASIGLFRYSERVFGRLFLGVALFCVFVGGEEISWGQRIFAIQSPDFFETYNQQGELNAHNFLNRYLLHGAYIALAGYSAFAWALAPRLLRFLPERIRLYLGERQWLFAPDRQQILYFLPCMLFYFYVDYIRPIPSLIYGREWYLQQSEAGTGFFLFHSRDQESVELLLGVGIMLFIALVAQRALTLSRATRVP